MSSKIRIGETGYAFITDAKGQVLAHPDNKMAEERTNVSAMTVVKKALSGESGTQVYNDNNIKALGSYTSVPSTGWPVVVSTNLR